jgi:hypothetical protein
MCPICWSVIILEGLAWLAGAVGFVGIYKWIKSKYKSCNCKDCKCKVK